MSKVNFFKAVNVKRLTVAISGAAIQHEIDQLGAEFSNMCHRAPSSIEHQRFGFRATDTLITQGAGSWCLFYQHSERKLNQTAIAQTVKKERAIKEAHGTKMTKKDLEELKETIISRYLVHAPVVETPVRLHYHAETQLLICDQPAVAEAAFGLLNKLMGTVSTETIHVHDVKNTLAKNLLKALEDDGEICLGNFVYGSKLNLRALDPEDKRQANFREDYYHDHVKELLAEDFQVMLVRLERQAIAFDLTHDFKIKCIEFDDALMASFEMENADLEEACAEEYFLEVSRFQLDILAHTIMELAKILRSEAERIELEANLNAKGKK